jgi:adenylate kinase
MRVVFVGPPGSGKGTQAKLLRERLGLTYIGTGDILRDARDRGTEMGKKVAPLLAAGQLVPDLLVNDLIAEVLRRPDAPKTFILDGYPRTTDQAVALDALLRELGLDLRAVVHFKIDDEVVVRRLVGRLAQERRLDDSEETVRHRLRVFRDTSRELLEHYRKQGILHEVTAEDTIEHLYATITTLLRPRPS